MANTGFMNKKVYGSAVVERLARSQHASALKKELREFKQRHDGLLLAGEKVDDAEAKRDDALERIGKADDGLDDSLLSLADSLVGAKLGLRRNPFADYSPHPPAAMTALAYAAEVKAAQELAKKVRKARPPADVSASLKGVESAAAEVAAALGELTAPQSSYEEALRARDELLLGWTKAMARLKRAAAVAYDEDRAGYRAAFAPASRVQVPQKKAQKNTKKSTAKQPPAPAPQ